MTNEIRVSNDEGVRHVGPRRLPRIGWLCNVIAFSFVLLSNVVSAETLRSDLRNSQFDNQKFVLFGSAAAKLVKPTASGLEIALPADKEHKLVKELGIAPKVVLRGNFEIVGSFEIVQVDDPDTGYGVGPAIYVATKTEAEDAATLSRLKRIKEGEIVSSHSAKTRILPDGRTKRDHSVKMLETDITTGRLRLRREGTKLSYWFSPSENGDDFEEIQSKEFTDADITQIRFLLNRNGANTAATIRWREVSIDAATLIPVIAPGRLPSKNVWPWVVGAAVLLAGIGGAWYWKSHT